MKKKTILSILLVIIVFVLTYLSMCYFVPGLRIKLSAEPMKYFTDSIKHMSIFKSIISGVIGVICLIIFQINYKENNC